MSLADIHNAWKAAKALRTTEEKLVQTVDEIMDFLAENLERYELKDVRSTCVHLETAIQAMIRMIENGKGTYDPVDLEQALDDLSGFRKEIDANL